ncbi:myb/SANT-like DNA-binding domain-containing protein 3 [Bacillus rossius redtenbacheri]|uniref:myb/SANT-like DNA-binding domain-containing protein 3 n=1 Tax=Bacillus rossius redtenbacheri TaxID=93214 RepID=UPI002FDDCD4F
MASQGCNLSKKQRNKNTSQQEKYILLDLVTEHFNIIENKKTDGVSQQQKMKQWQILADTFNCMSGEHHRTAENLKAVWENLKKHTRKTSADQRVQVLTGTGGGPSKTVSKDPICERVQSLIKPTIDGAKNPFNSDSDAIILPFDASNRPTDEDDSIQLDVGAEVDVSFVETAETVTLPNGDWTHYTPAMLSSPVCSALRHSNNNSAITNTVQTNTTDSCSASSGKAMPPSSRGNASVQSPFTSKRRPTPATKVKEVSAVNAAKIELIELAKKHAIEEKEVMKEIWELRLQQEREKVKQEKLQTELLSLQILKIKKELEHLQ